MKNFFYLLIAIGMAGCVADKVTEKSAPIQLSKPEVSSTTDAGKSTSDADVLLEYIAFLRRLSPADLSREHESLKQLVTKAKTDLTRGELAMFYAIPGSAFRDDVKALSILEPLSKEATSASIRSFALMMISFVSENKRLDESLQALNGKLKDEQRQSAELQQKLEALKSIEKSLSDRGRGKQSAPSK